MKHLLTAGLALVLLACVLVGPANAEARPYLSKSEACQQGREIARESFDGWGRITCVGWRADRNGRMRSDRMFVTVYHRREGARYPWALTLRMTETAEYYWWTKLSWEKMGPLY